MLASRETLGQRSSQDADINPGKLLERMVASHKRERTGPGESGQIRIAPELGRIGSRRGVLAPGRFKLRRLRRELNPWVRKKSLFMLLCQVVEADTGKVG